MSSPRDRPDAPQPVDIEYRERLFRVTDVFEELPGVGRVVVLRAVLLNVDPPVVGMDWLPVDATTEQKRQTLAALADRMLAEVAGRN